MAWVSMTFVGILALQYLISAFVYAGYVGGNWGLGTGRGLIAMGWNATREAPFVPAEFYCGRVSEPFEWWFWNETSFNGTETRAMPLWVPLLAVMTLSIPLWRNYVRARRSARAGKCPKCNYSLTGLPAGSACPECGGGKAAAG